MDKEISMNKIYYSLVTVLTIVGFYWMLALNMRQITGTLAVCVITVLLAVINYVRDIQDNKIIVVIMALYAAIALAVLMVSGYNMVLVALTAVFLVLYLILYRYISGKYIRMIIGIAQFICIMITYYRVETAVPRLLVAIVVVLLLNSVSEFLAYIGVGRCQGKSLIIIYMIIGVITIMAPVKNEPYDWHIISGIISKIETVAADLSEEIYSIVEKEDNLYSEIGYTENSRTAGGMLKNNDKVQLLLSGDTTKDNLYLKGNVNNTYDGRAWSYDEESQETLSYDYDAWMTLYACYYLTDNKDDMKKYIDIRRQYIEYEDIRTKAMFVPLKTLAVDYGDNNFQNQPVGDNFRFRRLKKQGFGYSYVFMNIDYSSAAFQNIIRNSSEVKYNRETWSSLISYMLDNYGVRTSIGYADFIRRVTSADEQVRNQYLTVWDGMSEKAVNLSYEMSAGSTSQYEKCQKIANFVSSNYTYNKNVKVPADVNVIDWFLFDNKTGYCVQFSTVLTEMLRSQGVPARMVEGFMMNYSKTDDDIEYKIEGNNAHAWVEAYMDGIGWIKIEPSRGLPVISQASTVYDYSADMSDDEETVPSASSGINDNNSIETSSNQEHMQDEETGDNRKFTIYMLILTISTVVVITVLLVVMYLIRRRKIRNSMNPDIIVKDILKNLNKKYRKRETGETFSEYMDSMQEYMRNEGATTSALYSCQELKKMIEQYSYSGKAFTQQEITRLKELQSGELYDYKMR